VLPDVWKAFLAQEHQQREQRKLVRKLRTLRHLGSTRVQIGSQELVNFASNDYLGLASDLRIAEAAASAAGRFGWGTAASRLVSGSSSLHTKLENETAVFRGTESALVFGSGYQANLGVISTLVGPGDTILSDAHNHASIIAGCRLSGAAVKTFKHLNYDDLERKLNSAEGKCLVVTDSLFSIRGDVAELPRLVKLCERFGALLVVDDAHGNAALGKHGRGVPELQNAVKGVPVVIGTYSKALGSYGGFVACDPEIRDFLVNHSRPFIYTTSLPIALIAANIEALKIQRKEGDALRAKLAQNVKALRTKLESADFEVTGAQHILSVPMSSPERALMYAEQLEQQGVLVYAMRWPSVPEGEDALRVSLSARHSEDDLNRLVVALKVARDRASGKDTANINKRSARRPTHKELATSDSEFHDETDIAAPMSASDSGPLPSGHEVGADFMGAELSPGDTIIVNPAAEMMHPDAYHAEEYGNGQDDGPDEIEDESDISGFSLTSADLDDHFADPPVDEVSDSSKTLAPEGEDSSEVEDPVIANIEGRNKRRKKRKRTKARKRTRTRD